MPLAAALAASMAVPASAATNLVKNGDFENSTPNDTTTFPTSVGGIGQIQLGSPTSPTKALVVTLAEWTKQSVVSDGSDGFAFVINADADNKTAGSSYPNQGGGFPSKFTPTAPGGPTNIFLWGPDYNGPGGPVLNGFTGPTGSSATNKFIGADGDYGASILSQSITGFDPAKNYILSYDYAGAQETGEQGDTEQKWIVSLGGTDYSAPQWINPSKGFTAWKTFTSAPFSGAGLEGALLSFTSFGKAVTSGSLPPFLLLDNVKIIEPGIPPVPPSPVPGPLPMLGAGMALGLTRRLRRRVNAAKLAGQALN